MKFIHGKVYHFDYDGGYILRLDKEQEGLISTLSYLYLSQNSFSGPCGYFAHIDQAIFREAIQEEIEKLVELETEAGISYSLNYQIY